MAVVIIEYQMADKPWYKLTPDLPRDFWDPAEFFVWRHPVNKGDKESWESRKSWIGDSER